MTSKFYDNSHTFLGLWKFYNFERIFYNSNIARSVENYKFVVEM